MTRDAEYNTLRQEILAIQNRELSIASFGLAAVTALIGYGVTTDSVLAPLIFILALMPLSLAVFQFSTLLYSKITIATYIRCVIEKNDSGLQWECTVHELRKQLATTNYPTKSYSAVIYSRVSIVIGILCIALAIFQPFIQVATPQDALKQLPLLTPTYLTTVLIGVIWWALVSWRTQRQIELVTSYEENLTSNLKAMFGKEGSP